MSFGRYQLQTLRGAGPDGLAYLAATSVGSVPVELRSLAAAASQAERWPALRKRLRLALLLDHPTVLRVLQLELDHDPPFVTLEGPSFETLAEQFAVRRPVALAETAARIRDLAGALATAHRLGISHGQISPEQIRVTSNGSFKIDLSGVRIAADLIDSQAAVDLSFLPAADVSALALLFAWMTTTHRWPDATEVLVLPSLPKPLGELMREMLRPQDSDQPSAAQVEQRLGDYLLHRQDEAHDSTLDQTQQVAGVGLEDTQPALSVPPVLGRFRLLQKLGSGAVGIVFRAEDTSDGSTVAIKVLNDEMARDPTALRRFHKEARLLREVNNPYVANLIEVNEDAGRHYLVMEYVEGRSVRELLLERGRLDEASALIITADVARALREAHEQGIVHRDIKPENILLPNVKDGQPLRVKLTDFGLARHVDQSRSLEMTRSDCPIGTPLYMSPEQGIAGGAIDARSDIYSLGATLFHLLAGRPPFTAESPIGVLRMHASEALPKLQTINPAVSDGAQRIVERAMSKAPEDRYADGDDLLTAVERHLRGETTPSALHAHIPDCDPSQILEYAFTWELQSSPRQLWPMVSNTERLNHSLGMSAPQYVTQRDPVLGTRRFATVRGTFTTTAWEEHPYEWVEGRRLGILRVYSSGPNEWLASTVDMVGKAGGGTTLTHRLRLLPRGLVMRPFVQWDVTGRTRRAMDRVYRRIDLAASGRMLADPFEEPPRLDGRRQRLLEERLARLEERGVNAESVERLGHYLATSPAQELARIRPYALARRLELDPDAIASACLYAAREGLLVLLWDLLCPLCRQPSQVQQTLKELKDHGHCEACDLDYRLDFATSVEMIFRVHPDIAASDAAFYCAGGPSHSPHVAAQVRVAAGESVELRLALSEGDYRLRGPQLPYAIDFHVRSSARLRRWDLALARPPVADLPRTLSEGAQVFALKNDADHELVIRVERTAQRTDALTAARAASLPLFRELFPHEVLSPGQLVNVASVTLMVADLEEPGRLYRRVGDAEAYHQLHALHRLVEAAAAEQNGTSVRAVDGGLLLAFHQASAAVRAALRLPVMMKDDEAASGLDLRLAVHCGEALAANVGDRLDYFGQNVHLVMELRKAGRAGEVLLTEAVTGDPHVVEILRHEGLHGRICAVELPGQPDVLASRIALPMPDRVDVASLNAMVVT